MHLRRILRRILLRLAITLAVLHIAGMVLHNYENRMVSKQLAEIAAKGEPIRATDLCGPAVHAEDNAAACYKAVFESISSKDAAADMKQVRAYLKRCNGDGDALSSREWSELGETVGAYAGLVPNIREAAAKPSCRFPIHWERAFLAEFPHLAPLRDTVSLLCALSIVEARNANTKSAVDGVALSLSVSDAVSEEPQLIPQLLRYSCIITAADAVTTIMAEADLTDQDAAKLDQALDGVRVFGSYETALTGERATFRTLFDDVIAGRVAFDGQDAGIRGAILRKMPLYKGWLRANESCFLDYMTAQIELSDKYYREIRDDARSIPEFPEYAVMTKELCSIYQKSVAERDRVIATVGGARIALALSRYAAKHGSYPARLKELCRDAHKRLPSDPFSGRSFRYRAIGDGYLLYSVGKDLKDDGGKVSGTRNGAGPKDIVWRVVE